MIQLLFTFAAVLSAAALPALEIIKDDYALLPWKGNDGFSRIELRDGRRIAVIDVPAGQERGKHWLSTPVDLAPYTGRRVTMEIRARWNNVTVPKEAWNGVKFMLDYTMPDGSHQWNHPKGLWHSRDWDSIGYTFDPPPPGSRDGRLSVGLESSSGFAEFDLSSLRTFVLFTPGERVNMDYKIAYPDRADRNIVRRGFMSPHVLTEADFQTLKEWNVNLLRYQIMRNWGKIGSDTDLAEYDRWLAGKLDHIDQLLAWGEQYGVKVAIDLHTPPGGWTASGMRMFHEKKYFDHFVEVWKRIAARYRGNPAVWGYDLINEPVQGGSAPYDYWTIQKTAAEAVRAIDPDTPVIIESNEADRPQSFVYLSPLAMDNVVYQVHMYMPMAFTHQGVATPEPLVAYPGVISGVKWDKEAIRAMVQPVRDFQLRHNARIYVGEFSAAIWAPGAERYLNDCIEVFEEYGWDWSYHAFREWPGWSIEHEGENRNSMRPSKNNPRKEVLLKYFKTNLH